MEKKKEIKSALTISKAKGYEMHKCLVNLDPERDAKFNSGNEIEVTKEELEAIGNHRWLEVKSGE